GSLDVSRLTLRSTASLDLVDTGTQVDLSADTIAYDSDDDMVKRKISVLRSRKGHPIYSREDIREQYCITRKELAVLEDKRSTRGLFGCLAAQGQAGSPCNAALFSCVQRASSDENIPPPPPPSTGKDPDEDDDFASSGFRRRPKPFCLQDPKLRFSNLDSVDSDSVRVVVHSRSFSARPRLQSCNSYGSTSQGSLASSNLSYSSRSASRPSNLSLQYERAAVGQCRSADALHDGSRRRQSDGGVKTPDLLLDDRRPKHVSFDSNSLVRSNTVAGGLEDVELSMGPAATSTPLGRRAVSTPDGSQERLLDARYYQDSFERSSFGRRRALVKTQATQTETMVHAKPSLPAYLTLSPRAARGVKHKATRRRKTKENRRAGTSISDDSDDEDVMEVDLVSKQQRLLPSPKTHKQGKGKDSSTLSKPNASGEGASGARSTSSRAQLEELHRVTAKSTSARENRASSKAFEPSRNHGDIAATRKDPRPDNHHSGPRVEQFTAAAKQHTIKELAKKDDDKKVRPTPGEGLTSPDSESSSSQFTERESSRSERSTSSSGPAAAAKQRITNADAGRQDTSDSTSEYVTATEHSAKLRDAGGTTSSGSATMPRRDGTDTSFESASSTSVFSSPCSRNGHRTKTPSPTRDDAGTRAALKDNEDGGLSSEETEKGHNDSSDESTKKEELALSSESGEYSLGRAEGAENDGDDEDRTDKSEDEEETLEKDGEGEAGAVPQPPSESTLTSPDLCRTAFDQEEDSLSEENSNSDQQITERYQPPALGKPEEPIKIEPPPQEEREASPEQPKQLYSSSEYLDSEEVATPSFDSATTTSGSFNLDPAAISILDQSLETSHASNVSTTDSDGKSVVVVEGDSTRNDDSTDVTDSSTSTQGRREEQLKLSASVSALGLEGGGAIPKQSGAEHRRRRERASRVRWETMDTSCTAGPLSLEERRREYNCRRSRSLSRSPEGSRGVLEAAVCSQCGEKVREHRVPGAYSWERPLMRAHCPDGRRSAPCPDYGRHLPPYAGDLYDDDDDDEDAESTSSIRSDSSPSSSSSSSPSPSRADSPDSTESEREFRRHYVTITHRMIHRKASVEMYRRVAHRCFEATKTVRIEKSNGEFGFRIHGSRPVVVSAIEKGERHEQPPEPRAGQTTIYTASH
ncbi:hypothetical protein IscW_ISCW018669, partial [Ixodes scapularis]